MQTSAEVIADSISPEGSRVTTMVVTFHRFVLAEFNTHRVFSRNSASSRAIPVTRTLTNVEDDPAWPIYWGSELAGMQAGPELSGEDLIEAQNVYADIKNYTTERISRYLNERSLADSARLHKSVLNRLLEPFMWHTVIVTSTEWDNFFALRCHEAAQPEIRVAAELMRDAYHNSTPNQLEYGQWHIPFAQDNFSTNQNLKASVARCAWVSTANHDGDHSLEAINRMYDRLVSADPMHASPLEHQALPSRTIPGASVRGNLNGWYQLRHLVEDGLSLDEVK